MQFQCLRKMLKSDVLRWPKIQYSHVLNYFWYDLIIGGIDRKFISALLTRATNILDNMSVSKTQLVQKITSPSNLNCSIEKAF